MDEEQLTMDTVPGFLKNQDLDLYAVKVDLQDTAGKGSFDDSNINVPIYLDELTVARIKKDKSYDLDSMMDKIYHSLLNRVKRKVSYNLFSKDDMEHLVCAIISDIKTQITRKGYVLDVNDLGAYYQLGVAKIYRIQ